MLKPATIWLFLLDLLMTWGCKDPYNSPYKSPATGYLVVDGYISGNTTTQFTLTRTLPLPGDSTLPTVDGAAVQVQGSDNSTYPLTGTGGGVYTSVDTLALNPQLEYRLSIQTPNGEQYLSDFVPYKTTPPIDSINWINNGGQVTIYANTHDPNTQPGYYQWTYTDIYEHDANANSLFYYDADTTPPAIVPRPANMEIDRCWTVGNSTDILIGNSLKLSQDVIYEHPLKTISAGDISLSVLYTILVKQYALTADGYTFLSLMQQNSESLGSIFDAQPSQLTGNIHCLTKPTEQVMGYISAGTVQQKRLWIYSYQVPNTFFLACPAPDTVLSNRYLVLTTDFESGLYTPITSIGMNNWLANATECLDCRVQGGNNQKPSFWPN